VTREPATAAPASRIVLALTAHEIRLALRRGESLLATFVIPLVVLLFFTAVPVGVVERSTPAALLPGAVSLAVVASSLVALGIATAYDRAYGVLKRLGGSPASRGATVVGKILATLAIEVVQVVLLLGIASRLLGWRPALEPDLPVLLGAIALGTATFAGLGLLLAGTLRAEATLALTNGLFLAAMLLGGVIVPVEALPGPFATVASLLPAGALTDALRIALGTHAGDAGGPLVLLAAWATAFVALAAWRFRWD
jgi:ABC-2 type transport system permease protein